MKRLLIILFMLAFCAGARAAQPWPAQPIRWIVPYPPGGSTDMLARLLAQRLQRELGQPIVIENKAGAGGNIGTQLAAAAKPDGYTWVMGNIGPISINPSLYKDLPYDPQQDLMPISLLMKVPNVIVVNPAFPANTVEDLIAYGKTHADTPLNYATPGTGTSLHLAGALFAQQAGIAMTQIPYKGSSPGLTDVMGGQVPIMFDNLPSALPLIEAGKLRALAVTSRERSRQLPQVKSVHESGLPGYDVTGWFGLLLPKGTPEPIARRLEATVEALLKEPAMRGKIEALGGILPEPGERYFAKFIDEETARWSRLVESSNLTVQ